MYILYINFRKISNFQAYFELASLAFPILPHPRLDKFESKTASLTGGLLGLVITQLYGLSTTNYPLRIASCYRQPTLCWISYKHYPTFCLCKPRSLYDCGSIVLVAFPSSGSLFNNIHTRTPIGGLVTLPGIEPGHSTVKAW